VADRGGSGTNSCEIMAFLFRGERVLRAVLSAVCSLQDLIMGVSGIVGTLPRFEFHRTLTIRQLDTSFWCLSDIQCVGNP
jgi:hypothetical protein